MNKSFLLWVVICVCLVNQSCTQKCKKPYSDVHIIFFLGGNPGEAFTETIKTGADDAAAALGCSVEYIWSNWDANRMLQQFKEAIYKKPDAICVMGHPGDELMRPLIEEAFRKGIIINVLNADLPEITQNFIAKGCGYTGQDTYQSGYQLATALAKKYADQAKPLQALVYTWDYLPEQPLSHRARRSLGIMEGLTESGIPVHYDEMPALIKGKCNTDELKQYLQETLDKFPDTTLIVADSGHITAMLPSAMQACGLEPGDIIGAGFDLSESTINGLQSGYLGIIQDQQPYLQGYLPVLEACLSCSYGFSGLDINTGSGLIDDVNTDLIRLKHLVQQQIR